MPKKFLRIAHGDHGLLAQHSGQSMEKVEKTWNATFIMSAAQAKEYGLIG